MRDHGPPYALEDGAVTLRVRVQPGVSEDRVDGAREGELRVRLRARAVEGAANRALVEFLARLAGVPKSRVAIVAGHTARSKRVRIETPDPAATLALLHP